MLFSVHKGWYAVQAKVQADMPGCDIKLCRQTPLAQDTGRLHHHERHPGRLHDHERHPYLLPSKLFFVGLGGEHSG